MVAELDRPGDWLNDHAKSFMPSGAPWVEDHPDSYAAVGVGIGRADEKTLLTLKMATEWD